MIALKLGKRASWAFWSKKTRAGAIRDFGFYIDLFRLDGQVRTCIELIGLLKFVTGNDYLSDAFFKEVMKKGFFRNCDQDFYPAPWTVFTADQLIKIMQPYWFDNLINSIENIIKKGSICWPVRSSNSPSKGSRAKRASSYLECQRRLGASLQVSWKTCSEYSNSSKQKF